MNNVKNTVLRYLLRISAYFSTPLPTGMTEFNKWMDSVLDLAGPIADRNSMIWLISNEIMHVKSGTDRIPKHYFVRVLRKFAANQLAAATVNELKAKQDAALKAQQQGEVSATPQVETSSAKKETDNGL